MQESPSFKRELLATLPSLRAFYGAVQDQPIPDKFLDLLEKLDQVELAAKRKGG